MMKIHSDIKPYHKKSCSSAKEAMDVQNKIKQSTGRISVVDCHNSPTVLSLLIMSLWMNFSNIWAVVTQFWNLSKFCLRGVVQLFNPSRWISNSSINVILYSIFSLPSLDGGFIYFFLLIDSKIFLWRYILPKQKPRWAVNKRNPSPITLTWLMCYCAVVSPTKRKLAFSMGYQTSYKVHSLANREVDD